MKKYRFCEYIDAHSYTWEFDIKSPKRYMIDASLVNDFVKNCKDEIDSIRFHRYGFNPPQGKEKGIPYLRTKVFDDFKKMNHFIKENKLKYFEWNPTSFNICLFILHYTRNEDLYKSEIKKIDKEEMIMWKVKLFGMNDNVVGFLNDNNIRKLKTSKTMI